MKKTLAISALALVFQLVCTTAFSQQLTCSGIFSTKKFKNSKDVPATELEAATRSLMAFRASVSSKILEREFAIDPFLISLIAKEHMLLIGPPGNAKTTLSKMLLSNIVEAKTQLPSFYSMQMNKEITLSDTHGSINFKELPKGILQRNYDEGLLGAKTGFIDEAFDIRPGAFRNILDVLAERSHSQGTSHYKGKTEIIIAATNKTLPEVYEEFNNSEQPRALIDRFAFVLYVPKEMESRLSDRAIFKGTRADNSPVKQMTFDDVDAIRALTPKVEIPEYLSDLAAIIHYRLTPEFEAREVKSMQEYREKVQNGDRALPPFRAAKYLSPRTLAKAGNILRAIVALDYAASGGKRELTATIDDLSKLRIFYQMNGPSDQALTSQLNRALKEYEKDQIKTVQAERAIVNPIFDNMIKEFNEAVSALNLHELDQAVRDYKMLSAQERRKVADHLKDFYQQSLHTMDIELKSEVTAQTLAVNAAQSIVKEYIATVWPENTEQVLRAWEKQSGLRESDLSAKRQEKIRRKQIAYRVEGGKGSFKKLAQWEHELNEQKKRLAREEKEAAERQVREAKEAEERAVAEAKAQAERHEANKKSEAERAAAFASGTPVLTLSATISSIEFKFLEISGDGTHLFGQDDKTNVYRINPEGPKYLTQYGSLTDAISFGPGLILRFEDKSIYMQGADNNAKMIHSDGSSKVRSLSSVGDKVYVFKDYVEAIKLDGSMEKSPLKVSANFVKGAGIPHQNEFGYVTIENTGGSHIFKRFFDGSIDNFILSDSRPELKSFLEGAYEFRMISETKGFLTNDTQTIAVELSTDGKVLYGIKTKVKEALLAISPEGGNVATTYNGNVTISDSRSYHDSVISKNDPERRSSIKSDVTHSKHLQFSADGKKLFVADEAKIELYEVNKNSSVVPAKGATSASWKDLTITKYASGPSTKLHHVGLSPDGARIFGQGDGLKTFKADTQNVVENSKWDYQTRAIYPFLDGFLVPITKSEMLFFVNTDGTARSIDTSPPGKVRESVKNFSSQGDKAYLFKDTYIQIISDKVSTFHNLLAPTKDYIAAAAIPNMPGVSYVTVAKNPNNGGGFWLTRVIDEHTSRTFELPDDPFFNSGEFQGLYMVSPTEGLMIKEQQFLGFRIQENGNIKTNTMMRATGATLNISPDGHFVAVTNHDSLFVYNSADYVQFLIASTSAPQWKVSLTTLNPKHVQFSADSKKVMVANDDSFEVFELKRDSDANKKINAQPAVTSTSQPTTKNLTLTSLTSGSIGIAHGPRQIGLANDGKTLFAQYETRAVYTMDSSRVSKSGDWSYDIKSILPFADGFVARTTDHLNHFLVNVHGGATPISVQHPDKQYEHSKFFSSLGEEVYLFKKTYIHVLGRHGSRFEDIQGPQDLMAAAAIPNLSGTNYLTISKDGNQNTLLLTRVLNNGAPQKFDVPLNSEFTSFFNAGDSIRFHMVNDSEGLLITDQKFFAFQIQDHGRVAWNIVDKTFNNVVNVSPDGHLFARASSSDVAVYKTSDYINFLVNQKHAPTFTQKTSISDPKHIQFSSDGKKFFIANDRVFEIFDIKEEN